MKIDIEASLELAFSPKPPNFVPPLEFAARIDRTGRGPGPPRGARRVGAI
jgi:hypothetical protein